MTYTLLMAILLAVTTPGAPAGSRGSDTLGVSATSSVSLANVMVLRAYRRGVTKGRSADSAAGIGDLILVEVSGLRTLRNYVRCISENDEEIPVCEKRSVSLYLDDREMPGIVTNGQSLGDSGALEFKLQRTAESDEQWAALLGGPRLGSGFWREPARLSIGPSGSYAVPTAVTAFQLIRFHTAWFLGFVVVLVVGLVGLIIRWDAVTEMLRDAGRTQVARNVKPQPRPFSLARCQMAAWFVVVIGSFFFIWLVTKDLSTITSSALVLIGMGAGTGIWAVAVDGSKRQSRSNQLADAIAETTVLEREIAGLDVQIQSNQRDEELPKQRSEKVGKVAVLTAKIADLSQGEGMQPTSGILVDLLTDEHGKYALHRVQMLLWTVALIAIFVNQVWNRLSMPEFSGTLLALMGISNGTYLGFKVQEAVP